MNEFEPKPQNELGRLLNEQAHRDIPAQLDPWPVLQARLRGDIEFFSTGSNNNELGQTREENLTMFTDRPKNWRKLSLVGMSLAAGLAIFLVIASVLLLSSQNNPVTSAKLPSAQPATIVATTSAFDSEANPAANGKQTAPKTVTALPTPTPMSLARPDLNYPGAVRLTYDPALFSGPEPGNAGHHQFLEAGALATTDPIDKVDAFYRQKLQSANYILPKSLASETVNVSSDLQSLVFGYNAQEAISINIFSSKFQTSLPSYASLFKQLRPGQNLIVYDVHPASQDARLKNIIATANPNDTVSRVTVQLAIKNVVKSTPTPMPPSNSLPTPSSRPEATATGASYKSVVSPPPDGHLAFDSNLMPQKKLAYVSQGNLWIFDSTTQKSVQITGKAGTPSGLVGQIGWSYDGMWLAYTLKVSDTSETAVWITHTDGRANHFAVGFDNFNWSPVKDEFVSSGSLAKRGLYITSADDLVTREMSNSNDSAPVWSPDGSTIAYTGDFIPGVATYVPTATPSSSNRNLAVILTIRAVGGFPPVEHFTSNPGEGINLLSWWPSGKGLLFQVVPANAASMAADGLPLQSLSLGTPNAAPQTLVKSLIHTSWVAWSPKADKFVAVEGSGRELWQNKVLVVCDVVATSCQPLPQPSDMVSLDPAWSPDGSKIAFVRALSTNISTAKPAYDAWNKSRSLWIANADGSNAQMISLMTPAPATSAGQFGAIQAPQWSADGNQLLFGCDQTWLCLTKLLQKPDGSYESNYYFWGQKFLPDNSDTFGFYGYRDWSELLAWYR